MSGPDHQNHSSPAGALRYRWREASAVALLALAAYVLLFYPTLASMVRIWSTSDTFSHGFLIFPAVAFLVYRQRDALKPLTPTPSWLGALAFVGLTLLLYVAWVGSVQVVAQLAFVAGLSALALALFGLQIFPQVGFAMMFSIFAVPFGEILIPHLMEFTAWFVVEAIKLSGIPVFRDGFMLHIPRGDFEVAKACSGIRYLMASFTLGSFFAYITYASWPKRVVFMLFSLLLPILANGLRAYGIVMIAHWTNLEHATGVDHLIYGWLFFGVIMFLMFLVGGRFADPAGDRPDGPAETGAGADRRRVGGVVALVAVGLVLAPVLMSRARSAALVSAPAVGLPALAPDGWTPSDAAADDYSPMVSQADQFLRAGFSSGRSAVTVTVHALLDPSVELIREANRFEANGEQTVTRNTTMPWPGRADLPAMGRADLLERGTRRSVLYWYQVGDQVTASRTEAKLYEWFARVIGTPARRALITLSMSASEPGVVPEELTAFASAYAPRLVSCVGDADAGDCAVVDAPRKVEP